MSLEGNDVSDLIEEHRDVLPMSDQLPTLDPRSTLTTEPS